MNRPLLGCIADDFTGADDLANHRLRRGMRTVHPPGARGEVLRPALKAGHFGGKDHFTQAFEGIA